jgi:hypothetical protein
MASLFKNKIIEIDKLLTLYFTQRYPEVVKIGGERVIHLHPLSLGTPLT